MTFHSADRPKIDQSEPSPQAKVAFLSQPGAYPMPVGHVALRETHMSWVFLAGDRVFKLKKPLRSPFLDFSTCTRREATCREEVRLNRRLARETYLGVVPLTFSKGEFALGGEGRIVDWLVVMRRLDDGLMLEDAILEHRLGKRRLDRLAALLAPFYRHADPSPLAPDQHLAEWKRGLACNRHILLDRRLKLPAGLVRRIGRLQEEFLAGREDLFIGRSRARAIIDAHGDLRPEHIWLGEPLQIIDCLEFNARLRTLDALAEIAFLDLECDRLGAAWAGRHLRSRIFGRLPKLNNEALFHFYRSYHAMARARLAIAHLLEPQPRHPEKWRPLALSYLRLAVSDAARLPRFLKKQASRSAADFRAAGGSSRPAAGPRAACRSWRAPRCRAASGTATRYR